MQFDNQKKTDVEYEKKEGFYSTKTGDYTTFEMPDEKPVNPAAGLIQRIVAFVIDFLVVSLAGVMIGVVLGGILIKMGPWPGWWAFRFS